jgi:hypothetical protein
MKQYLSQIGRLQSITRILGMGVVRLVAKKEKLQITKRSKYNEVRHIRKIFIP